MIELTPSNVRELKNRCGNNPLAYALLCAIEDQMQWDNKVTIANWQPSRKIPLIKALRAATGWGLKEAKDYADNWIEQGSNTPMFFESAYHAEAMQKEAKKAGFAPDPLHILAKAKV